MSDSTGDGVGPAGQGLSIEDVTVSFGTMRALDGVSLSVAPGETVAVVGPSGSGKSTLLRAIAGLEPLVSGRIRAGGRSLAGVPVHQRDLGLMFQDHALFPHLDVAANVAFGLQMKRWPAGRQRERVAELLALVGLSGFERRAVHELSGGEAQRVALARALAPEPALLMLDEPFGSLDRVLREQLTGEVRRLLAELGQTALHVTHDQGEAFALADRVAVLARGRVVQVGEPDQLWRRPADGFVARFLGHPNVWPGLVSGQGMLSVNGVELGPVSPAPTSAPPPSGPSGMSGRPAASGLSAESGLSALAAWRPGPVEVVVPTTAVTLRLDDDQSSSSSGRQCLQARVVSSVFNQGRYRVSAAVEGAEPALPVELDIDRPVVVGETCELVVALDQVWPLPLGRF